MTGPMQNVAVVGGGLAGITAALALQEAGLRATVYEARPRLGGATHSFQRDGLTVDNGQHIFLKCCTAYQGLLGRLGAHDLVHVQDRFDVRVLTPDGGGGRLRRAKAPGPLHLLPALAGYSLLTPSDRLRAVRASLALDRLDTADPELDKTSMGGWLAGHGQRERARLALWELFVTAALNIRLDEAALGPAAFVCKTALLGRSDAADIGVPAVPLGELHGTIAAKKIEEGGGSVRLGAKVTAVEDGPTLLVDGSPVSADAVVVAVPHRVASTLVPEEASPDRAKWEGLGSSPIVNVHVVYDRPVLDEPFVAAIGSPAQWIFDRTRIGGPPSGQYLAVSVSAADRWIDTPTAEIRDVFLAELARLFPAARRARVTDFFVTRERHATFRQGPGSGALRPASATRLPWLFLAGAWTDTGWPDTMEGAVRSGLSAARLVRRHLSGAGGAKGASAANGVSGR
ncbi:hydroxysqualene dehydroxylase HpnE [Actinomadura decatromicini]|uniref:FAD-dependent oxidoreductase n=1 Tax=Actinomadura decatromicini TaxID=2604572 RepID=A0A5D3FZ09_9ACTN|nr:hydroxysqualene dehydroxylase HpnE [Actinomadura decatromicini]TYK53248.1 FAD-dependent oxidoreductase [Actinomadura decatromicini]